MRIAAASANPAVHDALDIYGAVLDAVRADTLVRNAVRLRGAKLQLGSVGADLRRVAKVLVVGAGKAALGMAQAIEDVIGDRIADGVVATKHGHGGSTERVRVMEAGHPIPDQASVDAGRAIADLARTAGPEDLVIVLISGGASALMELPVEGVTLDDLQRLTALLLRSGATINEINSVRACLSQIKAGGLARLAAPARAVVLVLSDVLGNPLDVIGSGPCVSTSPEPDAAMVVLQRYGLMDACGPTVLRAIRAAVGAPVRVAADHVIVGDIRTALDAGLSQAKAIGRRPAVLSARMEGEAREVGRLVATMAAEIGRSTATEANCLILGGETTVTVRGPGLGGRSQEMACAAVEALAGLPDVAVLCAGTDGTDGPTDAAGGWVDGDTHRRAAEAGLSVREAIAQSDSYHFLDAVGGLLRTGPTQSNVGDIVLLLGPKLQFRRQG